MKILSNAFPTNMPDSEKVSQGGPANFAQLFTNYIVSNTKHQWIGLLFENVASGPTKYEKIYSFQQKDFYRLRVLRSTLKTIVSSKKKYDPEVVLEKSILEIAKLIHEQKPDIILLNGFGIYNWMMLKAGEMTDTPVVIQHAGIWTKELEIHKKLYSTQGRKTMERMENDSTRIVSHEIFLNEWSKKYYQKTIRKGDSETVSIVPLPFNFSSFKKLNAQNNPRLFDFDKKSFHIGIIARWDQIKNHNAILAMAKESKLRKLPWTFHAVTDIPDTIQYEKEKERYKKYVDVIPPLDREGISQFCSAIDTLVLPSIFDVSPTVVLEAIALNTPIFISPNVGFSDEFKTYGAKKWVVDFTNTSSAMKSIGKLMNKKMPKSLGREIKFNHRYNNVFEEYLKIFQHTLAKASK